MQALHRGLRFSLISLGRLALLCIVHSAPAAATTTDPSPPPPSRPSPALEVRLAPGIADRPLTGRLLIMFAPVDDSAAETDLRLALSPTTQAIAVFGVNVSDWRAGRRLHVLENLVGFPYASLAALPPGTYRMQASFERYETYQRQDGHAVRLPVIEPLNIRLAAQTPTRRWRSPAEIVVWDGRQSPRPLVLGTAVPHSASFTDTPWVRSLHIRSERLSRFWGRDVYLGALVTLPAGYASRPATRYPMLIRLGGLPTSPSQWREQPIDTALPTNSQARQQQQAAYENFRYWQSAAAPRMLLVALQHPTPYGDDSMAVDSLNQGPYADAIRHELIPALEREFRVQSGGWARLLFGRAEGGWSALALQSRFPEEFNGAWAICPESVDFRHFGLVDLQQDRNAFFDHGPHLSTPRAARRTREGRTLAQLWDVSRWETALADHSRSGEFLARMNAAFSPINADGYPRELWNARTGVIADDVAEHWYQQQDVLRLLQTLPSERINALRGKLRIRVGDRDEYHRDNAVRSLETSLRASQPGLDLSVDYGRGIERCWNGRYDLPVDDAQGQELQDALLWALERILQGAPSGADLSSWRY